VHRTRILTALFVAACSMTSVAEEAPAPNALSSAEQQEGWRLLWDGKTPAGWRGLFAEGFPAQGWAIQDGTLSVLSKAESPARGGDIVTVDRYSNFELRLEFRLTPGANSGIKYFVDMDLARAQKGAIACEFQILDDAKHPDAKLGSPGTRTVGALYDVLAPAADKPVKPVGEWNEARIVARGSKVEHWLNGAKVVEYDRSTPEFRAGVEKSKFKKFPEWGTWKSGHILLQDHGDHVSYRNIRIRELP
jgi:hypothetical protein